MKIPVGEFFDRIVHILKNNLQGFFDAISTAVKAVIQFLENTFLLEPHVLYPSVIIALLFGLLVAVVLRKKLSMGKAIIVGTCLAVIIGGIEAYRLNTLRQVMTPAENEAMQQDIQGMLQAFDQAAPQTTQPAADAIESLSSAQGKIARQTRVAKRSLSGLSADDYQGIMSILEKLKSAAADEGMSDEQLKPLNDGIAYYESFSLIDDIEPVTRMLTSLAEPEPYVDVLNLRTYQRIELKMAATSEAFPDEFRSGGNFAGAVLVS